MPSEIVPFQDHTVIDDGDTIICSHCQTVLAQNRSTNCSTACPMCRTPLRYIAQTFWNDGEPFMEAVQRSRERFPHLSFIGQIKGSFGAYEMDVTPDETEEALLHDTPDLLNA